MKRLLAVLVLVAACSTLLASVALAGSRPSTFPGSFSPAGFQWRGGGYF